MKNTCKNDKICCGRITSLSAVCGLTIKIISAFIIKTKTEKENRIPSRRCSTSILALQSVLRTLTPFPITPRRLSLNPWIHIEVTVRTAFFKTARLPLCLQFCLRKRTLITLNERVEQEPGVGNAGRPPPRPYYEWRANATWIYSTQVLGFRVRNLLLFIREFNT